MRSCRCFVVVVVDVNDVFVGLDLPGNSNFPPLYSCPYVDSHNTTCCIKSLPSQPCFGSPSFSTLAPLQYVAIGFGVIHVFGLPLFFAQLIYKGVKKVGGLYVCFMVVTVSLVLHGVSVSSPLMCGV